MIVEKQARADHPHRPQVLIVRHDKVQRSHDMRRGIQEDLALHESLADQREVEVLQVPQSAVNQLGAGGGRMGRKVVLLTQQNRQPPPGGIPRDARAVDPAADNQKIVALTRWCVRGRGRRRGACARNSRGSRR